MLSIHARKPIIFHFIGRNTSVFFLLKMNFEMVFRYSVNRRPLSPFPGFVNIVDFVYFRMEISTIRSSKRGSGRETPSTTTTWPRPCSRSSSSQPLKDGRGKKQSSMKRQITSFNFVIHAFSKTDVNKVL
jgi:hypothetical protein